MNISSAKVDELAQRLARLTGEDVQTAVERAIAERLSRSAHCTARSPDGVAQVFSSGLEDAGQGLPLRRRNHRL